ncbi:MAG: hypothetical protein U5L95_05620 [Candidatus Saccharibacteria bacterium]|nr:hypothetical protein [Candidatus Saccharibacteria bacterium]
MNRGQYDGLRKDVKKLEFQLKDMLDDHSHPDARRFKDAFRKLEDNLQSYKNPRSIEKDAKRLENTFKGYGNTNVISQHDINTLENRMQNICMQLRKFDNY